MPCLTFPAQTRPSTALMQYAQSLCASEASPMHFPMYTVSMATVLQMQAVKPHEELQETGTLTVFHEGMGRAAFVSHQWVGKEHPDPEHKQFRVLQDALRNILSGQTEISVDVVSELLFGRPSNLAHHYFLSTDLYLWYDFFSCPQTPGSRELSKAISSIPAYVLRCKVMLVLCPVIESDDKTSILSPASWADRGWCRLERLVKQCSGDGTFLMVKSARHVELVATAFATPDSSPGEGDFTVEQDRLTIVPVVRQVLTQKVSQCLQEQDLPSYRVVLNAQAILCRGLPFKLITDSVPGFESSLQSLHGSDATDAGSLKVAHFLFQNGFQHVCEYDGMGWSPLCYAALKGDAALVKALLQSRADPNDEIKKGQPLLALQKKVSVLGICAFFRNNDAMMTLVAARADVGPGSIERSLCLAAYANNATGIGLLCKISADPNARTFLGISVLQHACVSGACDAVDELLSVAGGSLDLSGSLHAAALNNGGTKAMITKLLEARAHVDERFLPRSSSSLGLFLTLKGVEYRFRPPTKLRMLGYHHRGATPVMMALLAGHFEAAATLIASDASLNLKNAKGVSARDLLRSTSTPQFLKDAEAGISGGTFLQSHYSRDRILSQSISSLRDRDMTFSV